MNNQESPAPSLRTRFAWWFGLYLAGLLLCLAAAWSPGMDLSHLGPQGIAFLVFFFGPGGLLNFAMYLAGDRPSRPVEIWMTILCFGFYPVHLILTSFVQSIRVFHLLLVILLIALVLSSLGLLEVDRWRFTRNNGFHDLPGTPRNR